MYLNLNLAANLGQTAKGHAKKKKKKKKANRSLHLIQGLIWIPNPQTCNSLHNEFSAWITAK